MSFLPEMGRTDCRANRRIPQSAHSLSHVFGGEGLGAREDQSPFDCEDRSPLSPTLSPEYQGEGVRGTFEPCFAQNSPNNGKSVCSTRWQIESSTRSPSGCRITFTISVPSCRDGCTSAGSSCFQTAAPG